VEPVYQVIVCRALRFPCFLVLSIGLILTNCSISSEEMNWVTIKQEIRVKYPDVEQLSVDQLRTWLNSEKSEPVLIDARSLEEYDVSHLRRAVHWDSVKQTMELQKQTRPIVVYCSVGYRSSGVAAKLQKQGYKNVYNLEGSIFEWTNSGYPVFKGEREVHGVHPFDHEWGRLLQKKFWGQGN